MLAAAALLALSGALALLLPGVGQAQVSDEALLSNVGQTTHSGTLSVGSFDISQEFTTGSNGAGYLLGSIELDIAIVPNTPTDVTIELWSATSDTEPGASIATLTHSTGTWATGLNTFNAPAGTELDADTEYFVYVSYSGQATNLGISLTNSGSADAATTDWSIGHSYAHQDNAWLQLPRRVKFRINGRNAVRPPAPRVTSVVVASAPQSGDSYRLYETIRFTVTFSEPVRVTPGRLRLEVGLDNPSGASGSTVEAVFSGLSQSQRPTADTPQAPGRPAFAFRIQGAAVRPRRGRRADPRQRVAARLRGTDSK